ncbi:ATP-binding protein [Lentibacter sp. XHP0401]|jgi:serine/threonine-protein kinase RsbW|uniref:ATP-binding protein n=1 Tax=Lentibacter sp. XHP0401 TaxID=2984334 RepID=UPI0021E71A51|nr:ATP-binding protein [Lentibacter sp. XHP0401]MCV2892490.1 ATP-binding protein [Lentibacter sp. XHP0401]
MTLYANQAQADLCLEFPSGELEVREALAELICKLKGMDLSADDIGSVEVVLGEVLNNIVEHAYGTQNTGLIAVSLKRAGHVLRFHVLDEGGNLPSEGLPDGRLPPLDGPLDALPEGGFGWYLVRNLAFDLAYKRVGETNELAFSICCEGHG